MSSIGQLKARRDVLARQYQIGYASYEKRKQVAINKLRSELHRRQSLINAKQRLDVQIQGIGDKHIVLGRFQGSKGLRQQFDQMVDNSVRIDEAVQGSYKMEMAYRDSLDNQRLSISMAFDEIMEIDKQIAQMNVQAKEDEKTKTEIVNADLPPPTTFLHIVDPNIDFPTRPADDDQGEEFREDYRNYVIRFDPIERQYTVFDCYEQEMEEFPTMAEAKDFVRDIEGDDKYESYEMLGKFEWNEFMDIQSQGIPYKPVSEKQLMVQLQEDYAREWLNRDEESIDRRYNAIDGPIDEMIDIENEYEQKKVTGNRGKDVQFSTVEGTFSVPRRR